MGPSDLQPDDQGAPATFQTLTSMVPRSRRLSRLLSNNAKALGGCVALVFLDGTTNSVKAGPK